MPAVKLDRAEADRTISDVTSMNQQIQTKLKNIEAEQMQMLQANWHGGSAATYGKYSQAQQEEFTDHHHARPGRANGHRAHQFSRQPGQRLKEI